MYKTILLLCCIGIITTLSVFREIETYRCSNEFLDFLEKNHMPFGVYSDGTFEYRRPEK
jgi:hypothetical protein